MSAAVANQRILAPRAQTLSLRKVLGAVHLWLGLLFFIPLTIIGVSGSLWMLVRPMPAPIEASIYPAHSIAAYVEAAAAVNPRRSPAVAFEAPRDSRPAFIRLSSGVRISVDPATMTAAVAPLPPADFAQTMRDIHGVLLMGDANGRQIVGWLGVLMCLLGLTGLVVWWPNAGQWKSAFSVKLSGGLRRAAHDLHRVLGICMLTVFLTVSFGGVYIVFPYVINALADASPQVRFLGGMSVTPGTGETLDADAALERARRAAPDGILRTVLLPVNARDSYRIAFSRIGDVPGTPQIAVLIDPWTGRLDVRDPQAYAAKDKALVWLRPLHSGGGLGWAWWLLVFASGLSPLVFALTGVTMWWLKRKARV